MMICPSAKNAPQGFEMESKDLLKQLKENNIHPDGGHLSALKANY